MRITTTWLWRKDEQSPELLSAYDEAADFAWGGVPDYHKDALASVAGEGELRTIELTFSTDAIESAFDSRTIVAQLTDLGENLPHTFVKHLDQASVGFQAGLCAFCGLHKTSEIHV